LGLIEEALAFSFIYIDKKLLGGRGMKKVKGILATGALAMGVLLSNGAITTHAAGLPPQASEKAEFHAGEKPLKSYKSEATGVVIDVYAANPADADKIRKERGWKEDEPVKIMHDKDKATANDTTSVVASTLGKATAGLINAFAPITAHASTGWDLVGTEYWLLSGSYSKVEVDAIHKSTGGDYEVRIPGFAERGSTPYLGKISFREKDPDGNPDDYVGELEWYPSIYTTDYVMRDISHFADVEADGIAEFYTMHQANFYNAATSDGRINNVQYFD
jgi:hypothetical protein